MVLPVEKALHRRYRLGWLRQVDVAPAPSPPPPGLSCHTCQARVSWCSNRSRAAEATGDGAHRQHNRTDWAFQPGSRLGGRTVLSGALRTSLRRTAGTPPQPHERRTRFPPDRDSSSSVVFLRCLRPRPCLSTEASRISLGGLRPCAQRASRTSGFTQVASRRVSSLPAPRGRSSPPCAQHWPGAHACGTTPCS